MISESIWQQLDNVLQQRKNATADSSYVASLYHKGLDTILKKVAEESGETIMAAKDVAQLSDKSKLTYEVTDLIFHLMVLLADQGLSSEDIEAELQRRFGLSGHEEKASR
jgi:phosphoribosyl-ATP pyrophosphohydrolase